MIAQVFFCFGGVNSEIARVWVKAAHVVRAVMFTTDCTGYATSRLSDDSRRHRITASPKIITYERKTTHKCERLN